MRFLILIALALGLGACTTPPEPIDPLPGTVSDVRINLVDEARPVSLVWWPGAVVVAGQDGYTYMPRTAVAQTNKPTREETLANRARVENNDRFSEYVRREETLLRAQEAGIERLRAAFLETPTRAFKRVNGREIPTLNGAPDRPLILEVDLEVARIGSLPLEVASGEETAQMLFVAALGALPSAQAFQGTFRLVDPATGEILKERPAKYVPSRNRDFELAVSGNFQIFADRVWTSFIIEE
ncbi:MAG: hypothetical protein AAF908_06105 [Pseudomonadota bacterium]